MAQWVSVSVGERPRTAHAGYTQFLASAGAALARRAHLVATCEAMARCGASPPHGRLQSSRPQQAVVPTATLFLFRRLPASTEASLRPPGSSQSQCRRRWAARPSPPQTWHGLRPRRRAGSAGRWRRSPPGGAGRNQGRVDHAHSLAAVSPYPSPMTAFTSAKQLRQACRAPSSPLLHRQPGSQLSPVRRSRRVPPTNRILPI